MKMKLNFALLLILINVELFSQDIEPAQRLFNHYGQNKLIGSHLDSFKINNFTLGWHWGGQYKNSKAMNTNQKDIESKEETDSILKGTNLFIRSVYTN